MDSLFQFVRRVRGDMGERDPAAMLDADILEWAREGAEATARRAKCFQRKAVFQARSRIPVYHATDELWDYCGSVFQAWYRDRRMFLANQINQDDIWSYTSSFPSEYGFDARDIFLLPNPLVTNYSTGTCTTTQGSTTVTFAGADLSTAGVGRGWAFGVGSAPSRWYPIQALVDATTLRLQETMDEAAVAGSAYVVTDGAVKIWYAGLPDPVSVVSYTTGTVTFTINSVTVTGSSTVFTTNVKAGMWIAKGATSGSTVPKIWYKVKSVESDTSLTLQRPYRDATAAGASYIASDPVPLPYDDWMPAYYYAQSFAFKRYGEFDESKNSLALFESALQMVEKEARERYAGTEGHTMQEYDTQDSEMWGGGSWS